MVTGRPIGQYRVMAGTGADASMRARPVVRALPTVATIAAETILAAALVAGIVAATDDAPPISVLVLATLVLVYVFDPIRRRISERLASSRLAEHPHEAAIARLEASLADFNHPEDALAEAATIIAQATDAVSAVIGLWIDDVIEPVAAAPAGLADEDVGPPVVAGSANHTTSAVITVADHRAGIIQVDLGREPRARDIALIDDVAAAVRVVARTAALRRTIRRRIDLAQRRGRELEVARAELAHVHLEERRRLERDLHDVCQQRAVVLAGRLGELAGTNGNDPGETASRVRDALDDVERLEESIAAVLVESRPSIVVDGISNALLIDTADLPVRVDVIDDLVRRYPRRVEEEIHACGAEAITNAVKHAGAERIVVRLLETGGELRLVVEDDGRGFDIDAVGRSGGLANLRARVRSFGGHVDLRSNGSGTRVSLGVPV